MLNIPQNVNSIEEGAASQTVVARGKPYGPSEIGLSGINDYTAWFDGDADMEGHYGAYDGPARHGMTVFYIITTLTSMHWTSPN